MAQRKAIARTWEKAARAKVVEESMGRFREATAAVMSGLAQAHTLDEEEAQFLRGEVLAGRPIKSGQSAAELKIIIDANKSRPPFYLKFHADMIMESARQSAGRDSGPQTNIIAIPTTEADE